MKKLVLMAQLRVVSLDCWFACIRIEYDPNRHVFSISGCHFGYQEIAPPLLRFNFLYLRGFADGITLHQSVLTILSDHTVDTATDAELQHNESSYSFNPYITRSICPFAARIYAFKPPGISLAPGSEAALTPSSMS